MAVVVACKIGEGCFHSLLDIIAGAARIVDPIFAGCKPGEQVWEKFLKGYKLANW